ncbi:MAG TPA: hypothetical protein VIX42_09460 [Edaphobacter sp.]
MRTWSLSSVALAVTLFVPVCAHADKLKGFYTGSGGITHEVHRIVMIEFASDGTAIVQQNWEGKDPQTWHAHWTQEDKLVTVKFDEIKDKPAVDPLVFTFKRGTLTPTSWDATALGVLGPPKLAPFGGKNVQPDSVASCTNLYATTPGHNCVRWDSRQPNQ